MLLLALALVAASAAAAHALDLCVDFYGGGSVAFKNFKIPGKDKCAPAQGFENNYTPTPVRPAGTISGMACLPSDFPRLILHYTSSVGAGYFEVGSCRVTLPIPPEGKTGLCDGTYVLPPDSSGYTEFATFRYCTVHVPHVPL